MIDPEAPSDDLRGFATIPRWLQRSTKVGGPAKLVYISLSSYADEKGLSWPSHATMAEEADCSVSTVKKALKQLKALGVVTWSQRYREDSGQTSNVYQITSSRPVEKSVLPPRHHTPTPRQIPAPLGTTRLPPRHQVPTNVNQVNEEELNEQSSITVSSSAPVDNFSGDDDQIIHRPSPVDAARHAGIHWPDVLAALPLFAAVPPDDLHQWGAEVLGKAKAHVADPTAFVTAALRNDAFVYQQRAFDLEADRASRGGNDF